MDMTAIAAFTTSLQAATDITKSMLGLKVSTEVQAKIIELQSVIMTAQSGAISAQQSQFTMLAQVGKLEKEIARLKNIGDEKARYQLQNVGSSAFVYVMKLEEENGKPAHWLCVSCFENGYKSLLQYKGRTANNREAEHQCPKCKNTVTTHWNKKPILLSQLAANKQTA